MIAVGVSGAAGRMGRLIADAVDAEPDLVLGPLFDPTGSATALRSLSADPTGMVDCDVVVEFTRPDVVMGNLRRWADMGLSVVVGTSGFTPDRIVEARGIFSDVPGRCLIVPNFSIGAVLMMRFAAEVARRFEAVEIVELHHDHKADAPSGTALETAARIAAAGPQQRAVDSVETHEGALGADVEGVRVHSVRLPGLLAHQEVLAGNPGERLTIRHDTTDRVSFVPGVLLAVRSVRGLPDPVTVGLDSLLT